jgi:glycosyltransferase involved in cell wall biosynthesis
VALLVRAATPDRTPIMPISENTSILSGQSLLHEVLKKSACLIPAYNEAGMIGDVVTSLRNHFEYIVVIDDGSNDSTSDVAKNCGAVVVKHCVNIGQGGALATGFAFVQSLPGIEYVVTFDADGQHSVDDAIKLVTTLKIDSVDVALGTRFATLEPIGMPPIKRAILKLLILIRRITVKSPFSDIHNGLRAFKVETLKEIHITQFGMAHASEISGQILDKNLKYAEVPVTIRYTEYSKRKGQSILNGFNILVDLIWR